MRYARERLGLAMVLGCILGSISEARAQIPIVRGPVPGYFGGLSYGFQSRRVIVAPALGGFGTFGYFNAAPGYFPPNPYAAFGPRITNINIVSMPPPVYQPPIIINNNINIPAAALRPPEADPDGDVDQIVIRPRNRVPADPRLDPRLPREEDDRPLPGEEAGGFRPLRPEDRDRVRAMPPAIPDVPAPRNDHERLLGAGRDAFAAREYGRALRHFKQATEADTNEAVGYFLLAQAQFAVGKYRDAVSSIHAGLRIDRDWPRARFRPLDLYGANIKDYPEQMEQMRAALKANPQDPVLLFLCAYQLWFDGQQDEARVLFARARRLVADPRPIDLFLQGMPGDPVVFR